MMSCLVEGGLTEYSRHPTGMSAKPTLILKERKRFALVLHNPDKLSDPVPPFPKLF